MNVIKASKEFKFQLSPEGFVRPTFNCDFCTKKEFIEKVHNQIEKHPYLLYFDGGDNLLYLDTEESKQLFYDCLEGYYNYHKNTETHNVVNKILCELGKIPENKRIIVLNYVQKILDKKVPDYIVPDYLNIEL